MPSNRPRRVRYALTILLNDPNRDLAALCEQLQKLEELGREVARSCKLGRLNKKHRLNSIGDVVLAELDREIEVNKILTVDGGDDYARFNNLEAEINKKLEHYTSSPKVCFHLRTQSWHRAEDWQVNRPSEYMAVQYLLRLIYDGQVTRIRRCASPLCNCWFIAARACQKCCSEKCRKKFAGADQRQKKRRAKYMRKFRKKQKERDARWQTLARRQPTK